jgi:hypothetical protein
MIKAQRRRDAEEDQKKRRILTFDNINELIYSII